MVKFIYTILLVGTSGGVGLGAVVGWLNYKLYRIDHDKHRKSYGLLLLGVVIQNGILVYALIQNATTQVDWRSVLYSIGLVVSTYALSWAAGQKAGALALRESLDDKSATGKADWVVQTERRLTAEEARNTLIEKFAEAESKRQDVSERRADDTKDHA